MSKGAILMLISADDLPTPVAQALDGWMKASQATAMIVGLTVAY